MRIQFKMEGGIAYFPGLSKPITIDSDQLPTQESDELKRLVNATRFSISRQRWVYLHLALRITVSTQSLSRMKESSILCI